MTTQDLTVLQAAAKKMHWHETRQKVLGQNIANADTTGYVPSDVQPIDFKSLLESSSSGLTLSAATTNGSHMRLGETSLQSDKLVTKKQKETYEISPSGNAVVLEEQLMKMNQNYADHQLTTTIYQKNIEMIKRATRGQ